MIETRNATVALSGTEKAVEFAAAYNYFYIKNDSPDTVYVSMSPNITAGADGVFAVDTGGSCGTAHGYPANKLYLLGTGSVQICGTGSADNPFKPASRGGDGKNADKASSYALNGAADYPLMVLNLYGKSAQDGTPAPDAPVDIISIGDSSFDIISKGTADFSMICFRGESGSIITQQPVSMAGKIGDTLTAEVKTTGSNLTYQWQWSADNGATWHDSSATTAKYTVIVQNAYNGFMYKCIVTNGSATEISNTIRLYVVSDTCNISKSIIALSESLCGIPVASGGNYTDSTGQMQCCDELVYNADGTGKIIKHVGKIVFSGGDSEQWIQPNVNSEFTNDFRIQHKLQNTLAAKLSTIKTELICSRLPFNYSIWSSDILGCHIAQNGDFVLRMPSSAVGGTDAAAFKTWLASNPLTVIYQLAEPQEVSLTTAEMSALRSLQTFEGVTNISNSADAEMSVKYCTNKALAEYVKPIISGLQTQIDTLSAAILSLGGNV